ncbi:unnamed protein product [Penicillium salamii]|uniref:Uncharacterized protein n=1 Tax=Penicillium salamii TaxID=1612424 RepID=A0A9W4NRU0_9EURO|nr:unnamed protein product [Penicillium salamii]CAG8263965.1 unnamed protein product [Penicillium salamii]CAG8337925.1 unnamed protein product [Penicillium salamii]CAG8341636.1 unnamed protein product [Penicillium salamii]CAG8342120.1 unnamed protein product [Penicillium salamii]
MKLLLATISLFAASAAAAKYAPGQDCRTNKGCDENCIGSKWSIVIEAGDARMVCDPSNLNSDRYIVAYCTSGNDASSAEPQKTTKSACEKVKGKMCGKFSPKCFVTRKASQEEDLTIAFETACGERKDGEAYQALLGADVLAFPTKKKAVAFGHGCDDSVFS